MPDIEDITLPPFAAIKAFHVAARSGRLKDAAERLSLTEPAISHQIRKLEAFFGRKMFDRHPGGVRLTADGERFFRALDPAFKQMVDAVEMMAGPKGVATVTMTLPPSFAVLWLIPRLSAFEATHPNLRLSLMTTTQLVDLTRERIDLSIRYGRGSWRDLEATLLTDERVDLVAKPDIVATGQGRPLADVVANHRLITAAYYGNEWQDWLAARGFPAPQPGQLLSFDAYEQSLAAASEGLGLLLGRMPLIKRFIADGKLKAFDVEGDASEAGFYLCTPKDAPPNVPTRAVMKWLLAMAAEDVEIAASAAAVTD